MEKLLYKDFLRALHRNEKYFFALVLDMGCSRQNVKKLAVGLEKKGFVKLIKCKQNYVKIVLTEQIKEYMESIADRHAHTIALLFQDFS